MYVHEIAEYARVIADDPDQVMLSQARLASMLKIAYKQFRQYVPAEVYEITYQPATLAGVTTLDLNNVLFGSSPTQRRAQRIVRVQVLDATTGQVQYVMEPVSSYEALGPIALYASSPFVPAGAKWWLDGRTIRFSTAISGTIQIVYLPDENVNWTSGVVSGSNVYVDDLDQFHDIIALLAIARSYASADGTLQQAIMNTLNERRIEMQAFFAQSRSGQGSRYVSDEEWGRYA